MCMSVFMGKPNNCQEQYETFLGHHHHHHLSTHCVEHRV